MKLPLSSTLVLKYYQVNTGKASGAQKGTISLNVTCWCSYLVKEGAMAGKGKRNERKTGKDRVKNWRKQGRTFRWCLTALRRDDFFQNICFQFWRIRAPSAICDFQAPIPRALVSNEKRKDVDDERNDEEGQRKRRREKGRWEWKERKRRRGNAKEKREK